MKSYEKPVVLANDEVAEGVYAGSGGKGCYIYEGYKGGDLSDNLNQLYEYNVRFRHVAEAHMNPCTHKFRINFDQTPDYVTEVSLTNTSGTTYTIEGNSVIVTGQQLQANPNEGADIGLKIKWKNVYGKPIEQGSYGWKE